MCCAGRALRCRGAAEGGVLARPDRPSRCTLPITALRVTLPSSAAIWLADRPASQSFFNCSTRSSVQVITVIALILCVAPAIRGGSAWRVQFAKPLQAESLSPRRALFCAPGRLRRTQDQRGSEPPHEMSYPTARRLQYAVTHAQESASLVHIFRYVGVTLRFATPPG